VLFVGGQRGSGVLSLLRVVVERSRRPHAMMVKTRSIQVSSLWLFVRGRVQGSGFRVQGSGSGFRVVRGRVQGSGFRASSSGFRVQGSGFRIQEFEFISWDAGFRVQG